METKPIGPDNEANVKTIRSIVGSDYPDSEILKALSQCGNNPDAAVNHILDITAGPMTVKCTKTSTGGARISAQEVKQEEITESESESIKGKESKPRMSFDEFLVATNTKVMSKEDSLESLIEKEKPKEGFSETLNEKEESKEESLESMIEKEKPEEECLETLNEREVPPEESVETRIEKEKPTGESVETLTEKEKPTEESLETLEKENPDEPVKAEPVSVVKEEIEENSEDKFWRGYEAFLKEKVVYPKEPEKPKLVQPFSAIPMEPEKPKLVEPISSRRPSGYDLLRPKLGKKQKVEVMRLSTVLIEDGDFPEEPNWLLVGRTTVTGLSTTKGRKLEDNEIVHFAFPDWESRNRSSAPWVSARAANAAASIVRFSTKRSGEVKLLINFYIMFVMHFIWIKVLIVYSCVYMILNLAAQHD